MTWRFLRKVIQMASNTGDSTPDVVARATKSLEGITAGPWETRVHAMPGHTIGEWFVREIVQPSDDFHDLNVLKVRGARNAAKSCCWPPTQADAEFIAAARTLVPELITEVTRLRAQAHADAT